MDFQTQFYAPLFTSSLSASASLTVVASEDPVSLRVIPKLQGVAVGPSVDVQTIRPGAMVRRRELASNNIDVNDLDDAVISFNDQSWRIKAHMPMPAPTGEADGVEMLILEEISVEIIVPPEVIGAYFASRYFGPRYFGVRWFG